MPLTGKELLRLAKKNGWEIKRISGSHHILKHKDFKETVTIPVHANRDLKRGTEQQILKELGLK